MKRFKKILTILLTLVMCVSTALPTQAAAPVTQDGISLTVTPDKTEYSQGETITATVKVENTNDFAVADVSLEGITPEGYGLGIGENDSLIIGSLAAGASKEISVSFVPIIQGEKIYETDLELAPPFVIAYHGNVIEWIDEPGNEDNKVLRFFRNNGTDFHIDLLNINTDYDYVVYDFDVKLLNAAETYFVVQLKDTNSKYSQICKIDDGVVSAKGVDLGTTLADNTWYNIAVAYNYAARVCSIYIGGTLVKNNIAMETGFGDSDIASLLRFYCPNLNDSTEFLIDNVRVYKGTKPCEDLIEPEVVIEIDPDKSIFTQASYNGKYATSQYDELLTRYISLHTRNGMVYKDGVKTLLKTAPVATGSGYLVAIDEICTVLGVEYAIDSTTNKVTINSREADSSKISTITGESGEKPAIDAQYFFETILEKVVSIDTEAKSDGMMIAGASTFSWPTETWDTSSVFSSRTALQNLNDYLLFERPTASTILTTYKSSDVKGQHPRIQATASDFARIKEEVQNNTLMNTWYQQLITAADYLVEESTEALKYELRDNVRLLYVSRDMLDHMYTLGMAYQLTGDTKYVDRAWVDLYAVSNFKDWHPEHDLDPAEMMAAVAIGYDWMYEGLSETQRETIEKAVYKNCFYDATMAYQSNKGKLGGAVLSGINHNIVLNGGFAMGAMAFMDVYPDESSYILSGAIRAADIMLTEYGPEGAWKEGPGYWEYATQYTSKMLSSLETMFGTCFSLDVCEGLNTAANYILSMQSDLGIFNYGDGSPENYYVPELFYLSNKYGDENITSGVLEMNHGKMLDNENVVLSLLWYDTDIQEGSISMPLDSVYWTEGVAAFRDEWTDGVTTYAAIHGGSTQLCHAQVDGGTFVYDYAGVRWAKELGSTPYDTDVTAQYHVEGKRWLLYRSRAEAHNTIVINPDNSAGQVINSTAKLTRFESDNKGGIAVLDMTENYAENASGAVRGFFFTDDRTSLVVRDEISLSKDDSTVYWFMQTDASVEIAEDGNAATLTKSGKQVTLEFVTSGTCTAELSVGPSIRMETSTSPITGGTTSRTSDIEDPSVNRIAIKLTGASGDVAITSKLTPVGVNSTSVEDYDKSISDWKIEEGKIAAKPEVQSVVIDGREVKFDSANQATFLCVEGKYDSVPSAVVTVDESKYTYEVVNATTTDGGTTSIIVKDKEKANVYTVYTVNLVELPVAVVPVGFDNMEALQVIAVEASAEPEANVGNVAWKSLDQNISSRWTSQGIGNWILFELEETANVDNLLILFKNGHIRSTYFNVSVSTDGVKYTQIYSGKSGGTAIGSAEAYEQFDLGGVTAKYIKIGCNGNSLQGTTTGWNNIGEVVFTSTVVESGETPTPSPTPGTEETPSPTPDGGKDVTIIIESTDTSYTKNSNEVVIIHCTGEYDELVGVDMDGKEVDASNYTVAEGSTIVEFKNAYLETLSAGKHTVTLRYTEGRSVYSGFTIIAKASGDATDNNESTLDDNYSDGNEESTDAQTPEQTATSDDSNLLLWIILLVISLGTVGILCVVYRKKLKGILVLVPACVLLAGLSSNALQAQAAEDVNTLTATETVKVGDAEVTFGFKVNYALNMGYEEDFEYTGETPDYLHQNFSRADGVYVALGTANAVKDAQTGNTTLKIKADNEIYQVNTRWSSLSTHTDESTIRDLTGMSVVYEFDLIPNTIGGLRVNLRSQNGGTKYCHICSVDDNVLTFQGVTDEIRMENSKTYKIAVVNKYGTGKRDVYVNNNKIAADIEIPNWSNLKPSAMNAFIRFHYDKATTAEFDIDNVKVYEGNKPDWYEETPTPGITIGTQPTAVGVRVGEKATLTVAATASDNATVTYQWYSCTDVDKTAATAIDGATSATYEVTPAEAGTAYYYCKVSAKDAKSVDSDVVSVKATVISFAETFDEENFSTIKWKGAGATQGIAISFENTGYSIKEDENDSTDKELCISTSSGNVDARFSNDEAWEDASSTSDLSQKKLVYEFDLKIKEGNQANFKVLLRASDRQLSLLCKVDKNNLKLVEGTETIDLKELTAGEYTITIACDFATGKQDVYVNNRALKKDVTMQNIDAFNEAKVNDLLRFELITDSVFALDNIKVYEGKYTGEIIDTPTSVITIGTQPTGATVEVNAEATLTVAATATENAAVTYQWYSCTDADKTGATEIRGATSATYKVTPTELGTTYYYCEVSAYGAESKLSDVVSVKADKKVLCNLDFADNSCVQTWKGATGQGFTTNNANYSISSGVMAYTGIKSGNEVYLDMRWHQNSWNDSTATSDMTGKYVVYEFDLRIPEKVTSTFFVQLRYHKGDSRATVTMFKVDSNVLKDLVGTKGEEKALSTNKWYNIAMKCNYKTGKYDLYLDDSVISQGDIPNALKTYVTNINDLVRFLVRDPSTQFELDNCKVYELLQE
ncbi:MAG: DUF4962 domain-containing protein [Lachnospiraceae bacterium]|nr:DUF4962 domain-containing protein [Lachnospiraceae bacterium]